MRTSLGYQLPVRPRDARCICFLRTGSFAAHARCQCKIFTSHVQIGLRLCRRGTTVQEGLTTCKSPSDNCTVTHRVSACAKRGCHVQLRLRYRGARGTKVGRPSEEGVSLYLALRPLDVRGYSAVTCRLRTSQPPPGHRPWAPAVCAGGALPLRELRALLLLEWSDLTSFLPPLRMEPFLTAAPAAAALQAPAVHWPPPL